MHGEPALGVKGVIGSFHIVVCERVQNGCHTKTVEVGHDTTVERQVIHRIWRIAQGAPHGTGRQIVKDAVWKPRLRVASNFSALGVD